MEEDNFIVILNGEELSVSRKVTEVSQYFHNILNLGIGEEIELDAQIIDKQTFDQFIRFCEINNYEEPTISHGIRTNNLQQVIDSKNHDFIKEFPLSSPKMHKLLGAATFLVCKGLKRLIAAVFACKIYFQDSKEAYTKKREELGVVDDPITFEEDEKYREDYFIEKTIKE